MDIKFSIDTMNILYDVAMVGRSCAFIHRRIYPCLVHVSRLYIDLFIIINEIIFTAFLILVFGCIIVIID